MDNNNANTLIQSDLIKYNSDFGNELSKLIKKHFNIDKVITVQIDLNQIEIEHWKK